MKEKGGNDDGVKSCGPAPRRAGYLVVRSLVADIADQPAFDNWYRTDHAPLAARTLGAESVRRYWSVSDPHVHYAIYAFADLGVLERAMKSAEVPRLMAEYDASWPEPRATRSREIWTDAGAVGTTQAEQASR